MKKDTEELILSEIILLKTEVMKTNSRLGYVETDLKKLNETVSEFKEEMYSFRDEMYRELKEINMKLDYAGEKIFIDHERRIERLEAAIIPA